MLRRPRDPHGRANLTGDDRPLPWELEPRVARWMAHRGLSRDGRSEIRDLGGHTSVNAMVRAALRRGDL
jgi:hypothetical protein